MLIIGLLESKKKTIALFIKSTARIIKLRINGGYLGWQGIEDIEMGSRVLGLGV